MRGRRALPVGCAAAVLASASLALAAPGIELRALRVPAIDQLQRVGVAIVGAQSPETIAARDFAAKSLVKAGHAVVGLPTFASDPPPARLVATCSDHDVDAVALVRISTDPAGWRANVDIRSPEGERIVIRSGSSGPHDMFTGGGAPVPVYATFSFEISAADVTAQQQARDQDGLQVEVPAAPDASQARPHLFVSENVALFGPARVNGAEFYRIAGRPDLAAAYEKNGSSIRTVRGFGYTALGIGGTTLLLALAAAAVTPAVCVAPNTVDALNGKQPTCGNGVEALFLIPLAFTATGGVLLASAAAMTRDPLTLQERRALAREYNARVDSSAELPPAATRPSRQVQIGIAGAPLATGNGGVMVLTGRF